MPTTFTGLLLFVMLLLPGLTYRTVRRRDTPHQRLSSFQELATIASASVTAWAAVLVVFATVQAIEPGLTPDTDQLVKEGAAYAKTHYRALTGWMLGLLAVATAGGGSIAHLINRWLRPHPSTMSSWWMLFDHHRPPGCKVYLNCTLDNGASVGGELVTYSDLGDDTPDRDVVLGAPINYRASPTGRERRLNCGAVSVSARSIAMLQVGYVNPTLTSTPDPVVAAATAECPVPEVSSHSDAAPSPHRLAKRSGSRRETRA